MAIPEHSISKPSRCTGRTAKQPVYYNMMLIGRTKFSKEKDCINNVYKESIKKLYQMQPEGETGKTNIWERDIEYKGNNMELEQEEARKLKKIETGAYHLEGEATIREEKNHN